METQPTQTPARPTNDVIRLPNGLLGFESVKNYILLANPEEAPFMWFQMLDEGKRSFLVVVPSIVMPDYQPVFGDSDIQFLKLTDPADAFLLCIVTLKPHDPPTVNLKGPIVINRRTLIGKQVIPTNANGYSLKHPLAVS